MKKPTREKVDGPLCGRESGAHNPPDCVSQPGAGRTEICRGERTGCPGREASPPAASPPGLLATHDLTGLLTLHQVLTSC